MKNKCNKRLNKKIILGLSCKYVLLLIGLLGIGGLLVWRFVYKKDYRFESIKIFISITSVAMTFIVFLRSFEVFEETQKGNAKDNVNKNFYAMLTLFEKKHTNYLEKKGSKSDCFLLDELCELFKDVSDPNKLSDSEVSFINSELDKNREVLTPYIAVILNIMKYINKQLRLKVISFSDYRMYTSIVSGQFSEKELTILIYMALYRCESKELCRQFLYTGIAGEQNTYLGGFLLGNSYKYFLTENNYEIDSERRDEILSYEARKDFSECFCNYDSVIKSFENSLSHLTPKELKKRSEDEIAKAFMKRE